MSEVLPIHPDNPQLRLIKRVAEIVEGGGVVVYPTDSAYALGCLIGNKDGIERIRRIRELDKSHNFTLMCRDLSELSAYARVDNSVFRLLKAHTPGAYTFILKASKEVPRMLQHPKRKTIGLRIPDHPVALAMLGALNQAMMSVSLIMPEESLPLADFDDIHEQLARRVDAIVDGGFCGIEPTSVIDFTQGVAEIIREGKGDVGGFR